MGMKLLLLPLPLPLPLPNPPPAASPPPLAVTAAATAAAVARLSRKIPVHSPREGSLRYWEEEKAWVGPAPVRTMMSSPLYSHTAAAAAWRARDAVARACREFFADLLHRVTMPVWGGAKGSTPEEEEEEEEAPLPRCSSVAKCSPWAPEMWAA